MVTKLHALRAFYSQRPQWSADVSDDPIEHATIEVPRDYADPGGERITIAITRRHATKPERRRGNLLSVIGGPGGDWGHGARLADRFAGTSVHEVFDLIGFDPRGTGESTRLYAEVTAPKAPFDARPPDSAFDAIAQDMRLRELACERTVSYVLPQRCSSSEAHRSWYRTSLSRTERDECDY